MVRFFPLVVLFYVCCSLVLLFLRRRDRLFVEFLLLFTQGVMPLRHRIRWNATGMVGVVGLVLLDLLVVTVTVTLFDIGLVFGGGNGFSSRRIRSGPNLHGVNVRYIISRSHRTHRTGGTCWVVLILKVGGGGGARRVGGGVLDSITVTTMTTLSLTSYGGSRPRIRTGSRDGTPTRLGVTCMRISSVVARCAFTGRCTTLLRGGNRGVRTAVTRGNRRLRTTTTGFRRGVRRGTCAHRRTRTVRTNLRGRGGSLRKLRRHLDGRFTTRRGGCGGTLRSDVTGCLTRCGGSGGCDVVFSGDNSGLLCTSGTCSVADRIVANLGGTCGNGLGNTRRAPTGGGWCSKGCGHVRVYFMAGSAVSC